MGVKDCEMPSPGLPVGAVNPAGLASPSPPERGATSRPARQRSGNGAERRPEGLALTGSRRAVG